MRLSKAFEHCREKQRAALVGYLTVGDPDAATSFEIINAACGAGLDVLELGIPFSDPTADGPVIQAASQRAIKSGMTLEQGLAIVKKLRANHSLPIIIFSYFNPILAYGIERFVSDAYDAGADGLLVVDLPSEQSDEITRHVTKDKPLHFIRLIAPTTDSERRNEILRQADGFVYIISRRGVTGGGSNKIDWNALGQELAEMRKITGVPLCVGFGISTADDVKAIGKIADGAVIGSAFQKLVAGNPQNAKESIARFIQNLF
ncbi:tryptophan synthase alpha chain [Planctomycetales bacterium]|nr:tryptophan synthase alpha chain [Planctomycetales bacterium]